MISNLNSFIMAVIFGFLFGIILLACGPQLKYYHTKEGYALARCVYDIKKLDKTICVSTFGVVYLDRAKIKNTDNILLKCKEPNFKELGFNTQRECIYFYKPK